MAESVDDAMRRAAEAIRAMRHIPKDETAAQARVRACAAIAAQRELAEAARRTMTNAVSAKRMNGNGHASPKPAGGERPLTEAHLSVLARSIAECVREWITEATAPLIARLDALEQQKHKGLAPLAARIAKLEAEPGLTYQGVWAAEKVYNVGDFVTDHGSLWHCWDGNVGVRPGTSDSWQLAVQRGRDAKGKGAR